jgi:hypothetical protein
LYLVRRVVTASFSTIARLISGRIPDAARCVMEIAFAAGFVSQRIRRRLTPDEAVGRPERTTPAV